MITCYDQLQHTIWSWACNDCITGHFCIGWCLVWSFAASNWTTVLQYGLTCTTYHIALNYATNCQTVTFRNYTMQIGLQLNSRNLDRWAWNLCIVSGVDTACGNSRIPRWLRYSWCVRRWHNTVCFCWMQLNTDTTTMQVYRPPLHFILQLNNEKHA